MKKLIDKFHMVAGYGTFISMIGMVSAVTIQVVSRFLLPSAPHWTEEVSRIFFVYLVGFGVAVGMRDNAFVKLELLRNYLSETAQRRLQIVIHAIICLFSVSMLYYCFLFIKIGYHEQSPALEISMSIVFASIFIMMFSLALLSLEQLLQHLNPKKPLQ